MGKKIKNPIEVKATVIMDDDLLVVESLAEISIHYGLACDECGRNDRKGLPLGQNEELENAIRDFVEEGLKQAKEQEIT